MVAEALSISLEGRAAKQNPTLFSLALCARFDCETLAPDARALLRTLAYDAFPKICRIPTHVFQFVQYCELVSNSTGTSKLSLFVNQT